MSVRLIQGDCLTEMARLEAGSVDLTVTSPPYDNLRTYNGTLNDWTPAKWQAIIADLYRITKDGGVVVWNVADATVNGSETGTSFRQALYAMECGFRLHDTMIWNKGGFSAVGSLVTRYGPVFEYMFVFSKGQPKSFNPIRDRPNKNAGKIVNGTVRQADGTTKPMSKSILIPDHGQRFNIWDIGPQRQAGGHPAPFPESLARDHILSWSNLGDTVFDPFLGSGTTLVAAINTGRNAIGIERDPEYFKIAQERVRAAQPRLVVDLAAFRRVAEWNAAVARWAA